MKINNKFFVSVVRDDKNIQRLLIKDWASKFTTEDRIQVAKENMAGLAGAIDKVHVLTKSAVDMCNHIKLNDKAILYLIEKMHEHKASITITEDANVFYRVFSDELRGLKRIVVGKFIYDPNGATSYDINFYSNKDGELIQGSEKLGQNFLEFLKQLIYLIATDKTEVHVLGKDTRKKVDNEKYLNVSDSQVILVNSTWNVTSIRVDGFKVGGHLRLQACGHERKDRKLVWINGYLKGGYVRRAKEIC